MRYETTTKLSQQDALALARSFFGRDLGLTECATSASAAAYEGGGGGVTVQTSADDGTTTVEIVAREWDYQALEFMRLLRERTHVPH